jgi:hypothetical protein
MKGLQLGPQQTARPTCQDNFEEIIEVYSLDDLEDAGLPWLGKLYHRPFNLNSIGRIPSGID